VNAATLKRRQRVGRLLRRLRLAAELTLKDVATAVGVSEPYVWDVEKGTRSVSPARLREMGRAVRATPDDLKTLFQEARCLPPQVEKHLIENPDAWDYDLRDVRLPSSSIERRRW
jgi:transcriptional regulator with XRE-family HTH domain